MVFDGLYNTNLYKNRGAEKLGIQYTDTDIYTWVSLPTITQAENAYITELLVLHAILELLTSVCQLYKFSSEKWR